jgi:hypothetical protein
MEWAGEPASVAGLAALYDGVIDGLVADEPVAALPTLLTDVLMSDAQGRRRVAEQSLAFARSLRDADAAGAGGR